MFSFFKQISFKLGMMIETGNCLNDFTFLEKAETCALFFFFFFIYFSSNLNEIWYVAKTFWSVQVHAEVFRWISIPGQEFSLGNFC